MKNIVIKIKPENISFDDIHKIIASAHSANIDNGFTMRTASLTGEELKERIGEDGICLVALDDEKLVGTLSIRFVKRNTWYAKGIIPEYILAAVLPEYQGYHINSKLSNMAFSILKEKKYSLVELDTAEKNYKAIKIYEHFGFKKVNFVVFENLDHYNVFMVKWLTKCPYSNFYCYIRYIIRKFKTKLRYKIGKKKRFGI